MARLRIAEVFASIQGEGILSGTPSTFVRVSGCNLRCVWCDTPYASWSPEGPTVEIDKIVEEVQAKDIRDVVLTGGEPMLFDPIVELAARLRALGHRITVETAGTIYRELACDLMSVSPKLCNSIPPAESGWKERHDQARLDFAVLRRLASDYDCQFKFVVNPECGDDFSEIEAILSQVPGIPNDRVLLMAEGTDSETLLRRQRFLVEPCMKRGWRLCARLHVDLFGNKRAT